MNTHNGHSTPPARTREQFVERWRKHLAGLAIYGTVSELRDGPLVRASKLLEIPKEVEMLLGRIYDDLAPKVADKPLPVRPHQNGVAGKVG